MKKLYTLLLLSFVCLSFGQSSDPFNAAPASALNANGWSTHSGATPGQIVTSASSLTYTGLTSQGNQAGIIAGNSEDINLATTPITTTAYFSALINLPNVTGLAATTTTGNYFIMFGTTAGASVTSFNGRIYVKAGSATDTFNLGVLNGPGGTAAPTFSSTDYSINTTYFIVVKFDFSNNTASLWVNPTIGSAETAPLVTNVTGTTAAPAQISSMCIRQAGTATAGTGNIAIDEVRISDNWQFVTSSILNNNQNLISGLSVYPNPVKNGVFYINTNANAERNVTIFDVLGKQVLNTTTSESAVNVSGLNAGVYMVKITEEGNTATKKLVIE